jgi:Ankyrin repeats (3 copies)
MTNPLRPDKRLLFIICMLAVFAFGWAVTAREQDPSQRAASPQQPQSPKEEAAQTELHQAARDGRLETLRLRLIQGMNPDAHDRAGRTPLMDAVKAGQMDAMRMLLAAGANINTPSTAGRTALIEAAEFGRNDAARILIDTGADLNASQRGWGSPLEAAERTGNDELASMLRSAGARSSGRSVGDTVCVRPWQGNGYCGVVEKVSKTTFRIRVTRVVGCENGCAAKSECSESRTVGGADGIQTGDVITTVSWCLTHTGVQP